MKPYIKTYHDYFGFTLGAFVPCESCGGEAVEIHHLKPKSLDKSLENAIENLIALCRICHDKAHSNAGFNAELKEIHRRNCLKNGTQLAPMERYFKPQPNEP